MQINYLILALTTRCNLRCRYCYHGNPEKRLDMDPATLEQALRLAAQGIGPLHIQLSGGEPCLVPELIERTCRAAREIARPLSMGIQVNGTCLNRQVIALIREYGLQVGVSLDGTPKMQEALRGRASETLRGLMLLEQERIPFRVTTVISRENVGQLDRLALLLGGFRQARGIGLDLLVIKGSCAQRNDAPAPAEKDALIRGLQGLVKTLEEINCKRTNPLHLREWDLVRRMLSRPEPSRNRVFCQAGQGASLAVHPDGRMFPCGQSLGDARFAASLGEGHNRPCLPPISLRALQSDCFGCLLEHRCPGDCPSRLFYNPPEIRKLACTLYQTLAAACLREQIIKSTDSSNDGYIHERRKPCRL
ncbi:MAG: radical SAM protein [Desulfobulbus sp.]|nr:radical SAM protein [Desulfobulbus sp.]